MGKEKEGGIVRRISLLVLEVYSVSQSGQDT